jgi:hypothetical protein
MATRCSVATCSTRQAPVAGSLPCNAPGWIPQTPDSRQRESRFRRLVDRRADL